MLLLMRLLNEKINNPLRQNIAGVKGPGYAGKEKKFIFFPSLYSGGVLRYPQGLGERLRPFPPVPLGAEGVRRGGFSPFPAALFLFCYPRLRG